VSFVLLSVCAVMKAQQNSARNCTSHFGAVGTARWPDFFPAPDINNYLNLQR
jgi:hypothetical protein